MRKAMALASTLSLVFSPLAAMMWIASSRVSHGPILDSAALASDIGSPRVRPGQRAGLCQHRGSHLRFLPKLAMAADPWARSAFA
jgi:hypothetical protein